jgi:anti-sigma factor RsiW
MRDHDHHLTDRELLLGADHELPPRRQAAAEAHLAWCSACQARRAQIDRAAGCFLESYRGDGSLETGRVLYRRQRLQAALAETGATAVEARRGWSAPRAALMPRALAVGVAVAAAVVFALRLVGLPQPLAPGARLTAVERDALPVASLTPGATWNLSLAELCSADTREERQITPAVRQRVLHDYGMERVPSDEYELDYLITPELGGAPDARNLWPQRYTSRVWNAHVKDQLERLLPRLVCDQEVALEAAQHDIARDWIAAYKKYFRTTAPLREHADAIMDADLALHEPDDVSSPVWRSASAPRLELVSFSPRR